MLLALAEVWSDFVAVGGFVVGVAGFAYTIHQVRKTKGAAEAAKAAAEAALLEAKRLFRRFVIGQTDQVFAVFCVFVEEEKWVAGALRADDLAELLAQLSDGSTEITDLIDLVRSTADNLRRQKKPPANKWADLKRRLNSYLDRVRSPF